MAKKKKPQLFLYRLKQGKPKIQKQNGQPKKKYKWISNIQKDLEPFTLLKNAS